MSDDVSVPLLTGAGPARSYPPPAGPPVVGPPVAGQRVAGMPQLLLLLAGSCLSILGAVLIAPVLPQMTKAFAGTPGVDVLVPVVLTVPALVIALTAPVAGMIVDRLDRKRLLIGAMLAYSVFGTAPLYLQSLTAILASRVGVGLCEAAIMTCCTTLIGDYWSGSRRSTYLGLQTLVAAISATVFLGLGGAMGASGWRTPFWLYVVAVLLAVPMARLLWQPVRARADRAADHRAADHQAVAPRGRSLEPLPWRAMAAPCAVTLVGGVVFYALIVELSFVLSGVGISSTATIGAISALMSAATVAGAGSFARLSRHTPRGLLPIAFGISAVGLVAVGATASVVTISLGAVIAGYGTGLMLPVLLTWAVNRLPFRQRGRGTGLWTGVLFLGEFTSPLILSAIGAGAGGLRPALLVLGVVSAVLAVTVAVVLPRDGHRLNVTED